VLDVGAHGGDVVGVYGRQELVKLVAQFWPGQELFVRFHDAGVLRGHGVVANQQLFVELFAGAQAGHFDGDVTVRVGLVLHRQARQLDHAAGQIHDLDALAHVQHKHIAATGHGASLDDELRRLGNGHEIAGDARIGQGDGPALLNLLAKQRHHPGQPGNPELHCQPATTHNRSFLRLAHGTLLGLMHKRDGKAAMALAQQMLAWCPMDNIGVRFLLGDIALLQGDHKAAMKDYLKGAPNSPAHWYQAALIAFRERDYVAACTYLRRGIAANPYIAEGLTGRTVLTEHLYWHASNVNGPE
jgi:tetratricopeptide (TPR) repeat protein